MLVLVALAILQTGIATLMMVRLVRRQGASFFAQINYLVPLFGVIWSGLYFADALNLQTMISLALIMIGIAITRKGS